MNHSIIGPRLHLPKALKLPIQQICLYTMSICLSLSLSVAVLAQDTTPAKGTIAVDAYNDLAVTADRSGTVNLYSTTDSGKPVRMATVTVPRNLTGVALAGQYLLVSGQGGVQILDISDPKSPLFAKTVELEGEATVVKGAGNLGYAAFGSTVVLFDIPSGEVLDQRQYSPLSVDDLAVSGDYLYVVSADHNAAPGFGLDKVRIEGHLGGPVASLTSSSEQPEVGRLSLYAGDNLVYVGAVPAEGPGKSSGVEVFEDMGTSFQLKGAAQPIDAGVVRPSGLGLLAYTGSAEQSGASSRLGVLDIADPSNTTKILQLFDTAGPANAVTLFHGYAYVAAGEAGLQVIAFVAADGSKDLPAVTLETSSVAESSGERNLVRLTAKVAAADQVRKVDFFLNGEKVASDGDYPFEYRYPDTGADSSDTVYACAEDIDGNSACTDPIALNSKSKKTALQVTAVTPTEGGHTPRTKVAISAQFSLPLDVSTVAAKNVTLVKAATKTTPATKMPISAVTYEASTKSIAIQSKSRLVGGTYKVVLSSAIKSSNGTTMAADYAWSFALDAVTDKWVSTTSGDWAVASNWTAGVGVPANGDNVIIEVPGVTVTMGTTSGNPVINDLTVGSTNTLTISGASLSIQSGGAATVGGTLNLLSGSLNGPGTTTITGVMNWKSGGISGTLNIGSKATLNVETPTNGYYDNYNFYLSGATLNNAGTVNHSWSGGGYGLQISNNSVVNNTGVWNLSGDTLVYVDSTCTACLFNNTGTFNVNGNNNTSWGLAYAGSGPININSGTLSLSGGASNAVITGKIAIAAEGGLNYGQGGTLDGGQVTGGGNLTFSQAAKVTGTYTFAGITNLTNGAVTFKGATSIATLNLNGGGLVGTSPVTITGVMNWKSGGISGTLNIGSKATLNVETPTNGYYDNYNFYLSGATLNNAGTVNHSWSGGGYGLQISNNSVVNNTGVWNLSGDTLVYVDSTCTACLFNNTGTFNVNGNNNTSWGLAYAGSGPININSGTLSLSGGASNAVITGKIAIAAEGGLNYGQGGTLDGGQVTGGGNLTFSQAAKVTGTYTFAGITNLTNGAVTFKGATSIATLNLNGGGLVGTSPVTITGVMNWKSGGISGTLNIGSKATLNVETPTNGYYDNYNFYLSGATLNNAGTVNHSWSGGGYGLQISNNSVVNNTGVWNLSGDTLVYVDSTCTACLFNNTGTFNVNGNNNTSWGLAYAGSGPININSGTLSLSGGASNAVITGKIAIAAEGGLNYGQGGTLDGGQVTGGGNLTFSQAAKVTGTYTFAGITNLTNGAVTFKGATSIATLNLNGGGLVGTSPVTITGVMNWKSGGISGTLNIGSKATLNVETPTNGYYDNYNFYLSGATLNNAGTVNHSWSGGGYGLQISNNSVVNNTGVWNLSGDTLVYVDSTCTACLFNNTGTFNVNGNNNTSWGLAYAGSGPININSGTLSLSGGASNAVITGKIAIAAEGGLNYGQGGTLDGGQVTGGGNLTFSQAAKVTGTYTFAGITNLTNGAVTFKGATSIATLNLNGGGLVGTSPVTITGVMNWKSGGISGTLNIGSKATLNVETPTNGYYDNYNFYLSGATLNNAGTVNHSWSGGGYGLQISNNSVVNNTGVWNLSGDTLVYVDSTCTACLFNNTGTFNVNGNNNTSWGLQFNNSGAANINSGTLSLNGTYPLEVYSGKTTIATGATLAYGQQGRLTNGSTSGNGTLNLTPTGSQGTMIVGKYSITAPAEVLGGTLTVGVGATLEAHGLSLTNTTFNVEGSTSAHSLTLTNSTFNVNGSTSIGTLTVSASTGSNNGGSSVNGAGSISVTDTLNWNDGSVNVTGSFSAQNMTLAANSTFKFQLGGVPISVNAKLNLDGDLSVQLTSSSPAVGTAFKVLSFANGFLGDFLDLLSIPIPGTSDYLNPTLTPSGLSFVVGTKSSSAASVEGGTSGVRAISAIQRRR